MVSGNRKIEKKTLLVFFTRSFLSGRPTLMFITRPVVVLETCSTDRNVASEKNCHLLIRALESAGNDRVQEILITSP